MATEREAGSTRTLPMLKSWRRYLAPSRDPFGPTMVKPGETGFGIVPWVMDACTSGCGEWHPNWSLSQGDPFFGVAFVKWSSPIGTNQEIDHSRFSFYETDIVVDNPSELDTPVVEISDIEYPDKNTHQPSTIVNQGIFGDEWVYSQDLMIPAWCVTPVDPRLWHPWRKEMMKTWSQTPWLDAYSTLVSTDFEYSYDPHDNDCVDKNFDCDCVDKIISDQNEAQRIIETDIDLLEGVETNRDDFSEAVCVSLDRYREGWLLCSNQAIEGNRSSDSLGDQWSPYWADDQSQHRKKKAKHSRVKTKASLPS